MASTQRVLIVTTSVLLVACLEAAGSEDVSTAVKPQHYLNTNVKLELTSHSISLHVSGQGRSSSILENALTGFLAYSKATAGVRTCTAAVTDDARRNTLCFEWDEGPRVEIYEKSYGRLRSVSDLQCFNVNWTVTSAQNATETPEDCFDMSKDYWYGGFEESSQVWPVNEFQTDFLPYVTGDSYHNHNYGDVIEGIFLSTSGMGIYVEETQPLYLSINFNSSKLICFKGKIGPDTPFFHHKVPSLSYDICKASDITQLWKGMAELYLPKPKSNPSLDVIRRPIWTTWATYKANINQSIILEFAENILYYNFSISQLEVDDEWTPHYGDFDFVKTKFPDAKTMVSQLTNMSIPVTLWVHWFFNIDSDAFKELSKAGYLIKKYESDDPLVVQWWRDYGGVLDFTNEDAILWYLNKLDYLKKTYNVTSFKFDGGEISWLKQYRYRVKNEIATPNYLTTKYANVTYRADKTQLRQELRVGFRSQETSLMVRMLDRDSNWSHDLGIKTLIPCALVFGLMGYPYVLPDMIGGNAYVPADLDITAVVDGELFVRWLQASTFLPVLQFSIVPWAYNETILKITQKFVKLHEQYADKISDLAINAQKTGEPIVRPLWWIAPLDKEAQTLDTEFLLGDDLLVAPVLDQGARGRDIYLPAGQWHDELRGTQVSGGKWLVNYAADLDELPFFTKVA